MKIGWLEINFGKGKKVGRHEFTQEDREESAKVRMLHRQLKEAKIQAEIDRITKVSAGSAGKLRDQIEDALELADLIRGGQEDSGGGDLSQLLPLLPLLTGQGIQGVSPSPFGTPIPQSSASPAPIEPEVVEEISRKIPPELKSLVRSGAITQVQYRALTDALYEKFKK
jgi:hypothetical protein